jgi:hypothetical protein
MILVRRGGSYGFGGSEPSERELREMLESRDRRMEGDRRRRSRVMSLLLLLGAVIVGGGFAVFYFLDDTVAPGDSAPAKSASAETAPGGMGDMKIDKGDVHFAVELMQFMGGGAKGEKSGEKK